MTFFLVLFFSLLIQRCTNLVEKMVTAKFSSRFNFLPSRLLWVLKPIFSASFSRISSVIFSGFGFFRFLAF